MATLRSLLASVAVVCVLLACNGTPRHDEFASGMSRSALRERFGEPLRSTRIQKTDDAVWGPIEEFWSRIDVGSRVEIWSYRSTHKWEEGDGPPRPGTTELYFVDGSSTVSGLGFAPDGVVYEAGESPR